MASTPCVPCSCIPGNEIKETWQQNVRITLCQILAAIEGGGTINNAVILPQVTKAFGAVPAAYSVVGFLDGQFSIREGAINNQTDVDIDISTDGVNTWVTIPAYTYFPINFGDKTHVGATDLFYRYTAGAPTLGTIVFQGNY